MIQVDGMDAGGHNGTRGGYFYHTVKGIDVGIPDYELLIIQEMHNAESGKVVRQSVGLGMFCYFQLTEYQNRDSNGRFKKKIEFFGNGLWKHEMKEYAERQFYRELERENESEPSGELFNLFG